MISKKITSAINDQIGEEFASAYLYLSMSAYCDKKNFTGFGNWLRAQAQEEAAHGMRLFHYVLGRGGDVSLQAIAQPPAQFKSIVDVFNMVFEHEKKVTKSIHNLYEIVMKEHDYATQIEVQWFITEQVEEEKTSEDILIQLKMIGEHMPALLMMDSKMGSRAAGPTA